MNIPFLIRNIPNNFHESIQNEIQLMNQNINLKKELSFYKSIFRTHFNSAVFNLRIKTINGEKIWVDKIQAYTDYQLLEKLDKDNEVLEWMKPIRCER
tara:strand:- start:4475 stop:4768 length:294 start_codon:yes stop_codon:yes gene_type:complete